MTLTDYLVKNMQTYYTNPTSINQIALNGLAMALQGADIVDPTSPFVVLLGVASCGASAGIIKSEALDRRRYPILAQTLDDLYNHMSDTDYIGIFATGSTTKLSFLIPFQQLLKNAVDVNGSGITTVVIPRDTQILVNNITLQIGYPIIINVLPGNLVQVYYDTSIDNPLIDYTANTIPYQYVNLNNINYIQIEVPAIQVLSFSNKYTLNSTTSFYQEIPFTQNYCFTRAYLSQNNGGWVEIDTTFSDMVYDINSPTLLLKISNGVLGVTLPDIYQSLNTSNTSIRIDVYVTQGQLDVDISQISSNSFSAVWNDFDTKNTKYVSAINAINKINDILITASVALTGGSSGLSFNDVYNRVIYKTNITKTPILPSDIEAVLASKGYSVEIIENNISNRMYLASQSLPPNSSGGALVYPLTTNNLVNISLSDYPISDNSSVSLIRHSSERATLLPSAIYKLLNGDASLLSDTEINLINSLSGQTLCDKLNSETFMSSPFHYVLDYSNNLYTTRAYYLNNPAIVNRTWIAQNLNRLYNIATMSASISLSNANYTLTLTAAIPTNLSSVICQLSYYDKNSETTLYLSASSAVYSNQAVFTFNLNSNFDINSLNQIELLNFTNTDFTSKPVFVNITDNFNIVYLVPGDNTNLTTSFDNLYITPKDQLSTGVIGATYETISIEFGSYLKNLYCPQYEILSTGSFLTYPANILAFYSDIVYQEGPDGPVYTVNEDGSVSLTILHSAGDPILDDNGNQKILHYAGDYILDSNGNTIPTQSYLNSIKHSIGVTMVDAKYHYATSSNTTVYSKSIPDIFLGFLNNDILPISNSLASQYQLWYKPSGESFNIGVSLGNGVTTTVNGILSIQITVYMNDDGLINSSIQDQTTTSCKNVISNQLTLSTLSKSNLVEALSAIMPPQAISFSIDKYLPNNAEIVNILNTNQSFTIGSILSVISDGSLDVTEDIVILYKPSM